MIVLYARRTEGNADKYFKVTYTFRSTCYLFYELDLYLPGDRSNTPVHPAHCPEQMYPRSIPRPTYLTYCNGFYKGVFDYVEPQKKI
jgi:hypothetical protein